MSARKQTYIFIFMMSWFLAQCSSLQITDVCQKELPRFQTDIKDSLAVLLEHPPSGPGRSIAQEFKGEEYLVREDRLLWQSWSETKLKDIQSTLDILEEDSSQREAGRILSSIANEMAVFHAFAEEGRVDRMSKSLERMDGYFAQLPSGFCKP